MESDLNPNELIVKEGPVRPVRPVRPVQPFDNNLFSE